MKIQKYNKRFSSTRRKTDVRTERRRVLYSITKKLREIENELYRLYSQNDLDLLNNLKDIGPTELGISEEEWERVKGIIEENREKIEKSLGEIAEGLEGSAESLLDAQPRKYFRIRKYYNNGEVVPVQELVIDSNVLETFKERVVPLIDKKIFKTDWFKQIYSALKTGSITVILTTLFLAIKDSLETNPDGNLKGVIYVIIILAVMAFGSFVGARKDISKDKIQELEESKTLVVKSIDKVKSCIEKLPEKKYVITDQELINNIKTSEDPYVLVKAILRIREKVCGEKVQLPKFLRLR